MEKHDKSQCRRIDPAIFDDINRNSSNINGLLSGVGHFWKSKMANPDDIYAVFCLTPEMSDKQCKKIVTLWKEEIRATLTETDFLSLQLPHEGMETTREELCTLFGIEKEELAEMAT